MHFSRWRYLAVLPFGLVVSCTRYGFEPTLPENTHVVLSYVWEDSGIADTPAIMRVIVRFPGWDDTLGVWPIYGGDDLTFDVSPSLDGAEIIAEGLDSDSVAVYRGSDTLGLTGTDSISLLLVMRQLPPAAPSRPTTYSFLFTEIELEWADNSSNESGFIVYRRTDNSPIRVLDTIDANTRIFTDNTVSRSVTYYYSVASFNGAGVSERTPEVRDTSCDPNANVPPSFSLDLVDVPAMAVVGGEYVAWIEATDGNQTDSLRYEWALAGLRGTSRRIEWVPESGDTGKFSALGVVSDGRGGADTLRWDVKVILPGAVIGARWDAASLSLLYDREDVGEWIDSGNALRMAQQLADSRPKYYESADGGAAVRFTANDYLCTPDIPLWSFGDSAFTIHLAVKMLVLPDTGRCVLIGQGGDGISADPNNTWSLSVSANGSVGLRAVAAGAAIADVQSDSGTVIAGVWHHIAAVRSGDALAVYVDGTSVAAGTLNLSWPDNTYCLAMGAMPRNEGAIRDFVPDAFIDDVEVVKGTAVWTSDFTPPAR